MINPKSIRTRTELEHKAPRRVDAESQATKGQPVRWLTAREAAKYLRVKARTVLLWVRQGKVKAFALSGTKRHVWRFRQADLDAALLESPVLLSTTPSVRPAER